MTTELSRDSVDQLRAVLRHYYGILLEHMFQPAFQAVLSELYELEPQDRPDFVTNVILTPGEMALRGVSTFEGILTQRSSFGDRRPTLFCVRMMIPEPYAQCWQNVNLTFDTEHDVAATPRDARAWRQPLDFDAQSEILSGRCLPAAD